jgi:hypothetical protein
VLLCFQQWAVKNQTPCIPFQIGGLWVKREFNWLFTCHCNGVFAMLPISILLSGRWKVPDKKTARDLFIIFDCRLQQLRVHFRLYPIIGIHKTYPITPRIIQSNISRKAHPSICLMDDLNAGVGFCISVTYLAAAVRRAVINENDIQILMRLVKDAVYAAW